MLKSNLFRGDLKLEAAATLDPAHILPGASGPHVKKIHLALLKLDGARIRQSELLSMSYGTSTADAVLAYKRKRDVVNRSYQHTADNIVGRMTIARMDADLLPLDGSSRSPRIVPINPTPSQVAPELAQVSQRPTVRLGFNIGLGSLSALPQILPAPNFQMQVPVGGTAIVHIVDGPGETASTLDPSVAEIFDPAEPAAKGAVFITANRHICHVRGLNDGSTSIVVTKSNDFGIPTGLVRMPFAVGIDVSKFVSPRGTPQNPTQKGLMVNIFGEKETEPGFVNFSTVPEFARGRPLTNDPKRPPGLVDHTVSDICLRNSPIRASLNEMERIAQPNCRVTLALNSDPKGDLVPGGADAQLQAFRDRFKNRRPIIDKVITGIFDDGTPWSFKCIVCELP